MQSEVTMLMPEGSPDAALVVRRSDGRIAFERIDARLAFAARAAAKWLRDESRDSSWIEQDSLID